MLASNNPSRKTWVAIPENSDFPIQNLPFGILSKNGGIKKVGVALGDYAIDLSALFDFGYLDLETYSHHHFENDYLNELLSLGKDKVQALRERISYLTLISIRVKTTQEMLGKCFAILKTRCFLTGNTSL
jgi:fumarylacetoacetase